MCKNLFNRLLFSRLLFNRLLFNRLFISGILASFVFVSVSATAENAIPQLSDQQRITRLERLLSVDNQRKKMQTIEAMKDDMASLHNQIEQMNNQINIIKQRQRSLYQDMDRRINNLELRASSVLPSGVPAPVLPSSASSGATAAANINDKQAYSAAFNLLKEGKYPQSITAFEQFLIQYPQSKYANNAQYWLGEANYVSRKYKESLKNFEQLISQFPDSAKIPGARLKIGYVYFELKNWPAARDALQSVISLYPKMTVAKKANERLQRMKREGH